MTPFPKKSLAIVPYRQREQLEHLGPKGTRYVFKTYVWAWATVLDEDKEKRYCININYPRCRGWLSIDEMIEPRDWDNRGPLE